MLRDAGTPPDVPVVFDAELAAILATGAGLGDEQLRQIARHAGVADSAVTYFKRVISQAPSDTTSP